MVIKWTQLKDLRDLLGWTQAELANHIGVHPKTIVNWEANDVPPRSAYKITRKLGEELSYLEGVRQGHLEGVTLEEWKQWQRDSLELAKQRDAMLDEDERQMIQVDAEYRAEVAEEAMDEAQKEYEEQLQRISTLRQFTSLDLLGELVRREKTELIPHAEPNVGGVGDAVDPHEIDLSQGDVDLAATDDNSSVQEQSHPRYEDENQDQEA